MGNGVTINLEGLSVSAFRDLDRDGMFGAEIEDYCEIIANGLTVGVVKRKPEGFNYTVAGKCNGVASTRLYYKNRWGETLTEDVG